MKYIRESEVELESKGLRVKKFHQVGLIYDFGGNMAAGADLSRPFTVLEGGYNREDTAEDENLENVRQLANRKPPRHLSVMRHSVGSARLLAASDFVS